MKKQKYYLIINYDRVDSFYSCSEDQIIEENNYIQIDEEYYNSLMQSNIDYTDGKYKFDKNTKKIIETEEEIPKYYINRRKSEIRGMREMFVFPIINRGQAWYWTLSEKQTAELKEWYNAWLDATDTGIIPDTPEWLVGDANGNSME